MERNFNLIFVGGAPRSGTTLVQRILLNHKMISGGPEFDNMPNIVNLYNSLICSYNNGRIDALTSKENIRTSVNLFVKNLLNEIVNDGEVYVSEKTPTNILVMDKISEIFPDSKLIIVFRNPYDIVASMKQVKINFIKANKRKPDGFIKNIYSMAEFTKKCFIKGIKMLDKKNENVLLVIYENLISSPEKEIQHICNFLNITSEDKMLEFENDNNILTNKIKFDDIWYNKEIYANKIDNNRSNNWKTKLTGMEQYIIHRTFKSMFNEINRYQYFTEKINISSLNRIKGAIVFSYFSLIKRIIISLTKTKIFNKISVIIIGNKD